LKQPGQFVGRRNAARTTYTNPLTWLRVFDSKIDEMRVAAAARQQRKRAAAVASATAEAAEQEAESEEKDQRNAGDGDRDPLVVDGGACRLCGSGKHTTGRHCCHVCTERGSHRAAACPNRGKGCALCGAEDHATGLHLCSVCKLRGHRGRNCHDLRSVGWAGAFVGFVRLLVFWMIGAGLGGGGLRGLFAVCLGL
jgi:hypothetical protein